MKCSSLRQAPLIFFLSFALACGKPKSLTMDKGTNPSSSPDAWESSETTDLPPNDEDLAAFEEDWNKGSPEINAEDIPAEKDQLKEMMAAMQKGQIQGKDNKDSQALYNMMAQALKSKPASNSEEDLDDHANNMNLLLLAIIGCAVGVSYAKTEKESTSYCVSGALAGATLSALFGSGSGSDSGSVTPPANYY